MKAEPWIGDQLPLPPPVRAGPQRYGVNSPGISGELVIIVAAPTAGHRAVHEFGVSRLPTPIVRRKEAGGRRVAHPHGRGGPAAVSEQRPGRVRLSVILTFRGSGPCINSGDSTLYLWQPSSRARPEVVTTPVGG